MSRELIEYRVAEGAVTVTARSSVHDSTTVWSKLAGKILSNPEEPGVGSAADITVDMRVFHAGDRLKNWKLKSDLEPDRHPTAALHLVRLEEVRKEGSQVRGVAVGTLKWRGRETEIRAKGAVDFAEDGLTANAEFELDVTRLGVKPPQFLMLKVDPMVSVHVWLTARR